MLILIEKQKSKNELNNYAKRITNFECWIDGSLKLLKDKGTMIFIIPTNLLDRSLIALSKKAGSFKIYPIWPNPKKSSKRII